MERYEIRYVKNRRRNEHRMYKKLKGNTIRTPNISCVLKGVARVYYVLKQIHCSGIHKEQQQGPRPLCQQPSPKIFNPCSYLDRFIYTK